MADTADDRLLARVAAELRRPREPRPGFDERVMAAVRAPHPPVPARAWAWLREPRALALSPLGGGGLALAAVVAGLAIGGVTMWRALRSAPGPALAGSAAAGAGAGGGTPARAIVTFVLVAPGARSVALAGDFDGWDRGAVRRGCGPSTCCSLRAATSTRSWWTATGSWRIPRPRPPWATTSASPRRS